MSWKFSFAFAAIVCGAVCWPAEGMTHSGAPTAIAKIDPNSLAADVVPAQSYAYIPGSYEYVRVIDTTTGVVIATVHVGPGVESVAVNPAGTRAYVTNADSANVSVIDTSSNTVVATVPVGNYPRGVIVSPDGARVFVTNNFSHSVSVIATSTHTVVATIPTGTSAYPLGIDINPAGTRVYVVNDGPDTVSVIDTASNAVVAAVPVGPNSRGIAVNPAGTRVYVASNFGLQISVIDTISNVVVDTILLGKRPFGLAFNPIGTRLYISNPSNDYSTLGDFDSVLDTSNNTVTATIALASGTQPRGVSVSSTGTRAYVSNIMQSGSSTVSVIDTATNAIISTWTVAPDSFEYMGRLAIGTPPAVPPGAPIIGTASAGNAQAFVSFMPPASNGGSPSSGYTVISSPAGGVDSHAGSLILDHVITGLTSGVAYTFTVVASNANGTGPASAVSNSVTPTTAGEARAYVALNTGSVAVVSLASNTVIASVPVGGNPASVAVNAAGTRVYVANNSSNSVSVINTATNTVVATIPVGTGPVSVALNPAGTRAYVANTTGKTISVIDTAANIVVGTTTTAPSGASHVVVHPGGSFVYASVGYIWKIDTAANLVFRKTGLYSDKAAFTPDGTRAYLSIGGLGHRLSVVDVASDSLITEILSGLNPGSTAINAAGTSAYVVLATSASSSSIAVVDTATNAVVSTVPITAESRDVAINPSGTRVYVSNGTYARVTVIDTASNTVLTTIPTPGGYAQGIAIGSPPLSNPTVPVAPSAVSATPGNATATVAFAASASDGGSTITGYKVTSIPAGGLDNNAGSLATSHLVSGLVNGVSYTFTVVATNAIGDSVPSTPSSSVVPFVLVGLLSDVATSEGESGAKLVNFAINLSGPTSLAVTFDLYTAPGTASPGVDYASNAAIGVSIAPGQTSANFPVTVNGDTEVEGHETFTVNLVNVVNARMGDGQTLGTIVNDDLAQLSVLDASVVEGNDGTSTASFVVQLSRPMPNPVTFDIATSNGSASAGSDYLARSQLGRYLDAGRTRQLFEVAIKGDALPETNETFNVTISNVVGATLGDGVAVGTIVDDDAAAATPAALRTGPLRRVGRRLPASP